MRDKRKLDRKPWLEEWPLIVLLRIRRRVTWSIRVSSKGKTSQKSESAGKTNDHKPTIVKFHGKLAAALRAEGMQVGETVKQVARDARMPPSAKQIKREVLRATKFLLPKEKSSAEQQAYWKARETPFRSGKMERLGLDMGTKNIVLAYRKDKQDKQIAFRREVNGFLQILKGDNFTKQMLVQSGVPYIARDKDFIAIGEKAEELAFSFGKELQRPMVNGVLSITERQAMAIMGVIVKSIIGKLNDDVILYFCIPAAAINHTVNVDYHQKIIQAILESFEMKVKINGFSINEARAIVISRSPDRSAIGISFGAGMVNVCYCLYGIPIYEFSIVGSGDMIDAESARVTGESTTAIARIKESSDMKLDEGMPQDFIKRAIYLNYTILIERVAKGVAAGFKVNESKAKAPKPMPIILAGGTASISGFLKFFKEVFTKQDMPFAVGEITLADRPLYAVAEGCLTAAEMHEDKK
jgi:hypothetical protein